MNNLWNRSVGPFDEAAAQRHRHMGLLDCNGDVNADAVNFLAHLCAGLFFDALCDSYVEMQTVSRICQAFCKSENVEAQRVVLMICSEYRVRIVIPASEMWESGNERPDYVLQNMVGASIDLVIIKVEREAGFAIGSRRLASRSQRYFFAHREDLHRIGSRVKCRMLAVGPRRCLVDCYGHDLDLTQREMRYAAIPDLRDEYHPGMELESVVKVYDSTKDELIISVKETETNPILGAEQRHPVGSRRLAVISGKYGGGVFCNLPDGVVCMCNYSFQHEDSDFMVGENVMLVVQRYNEEKLQMFGKILSKW